MRAYQIGTLSAINIARNFRRRYYARMKSATDDNFAAIARAGIPKIKSDRITAIEHACRELASSTIALKRKRESRELAAILGICDRFFSWFELAQV